MEQFKKNTVYLGWKQKILCCTHLFCIAWRTGEKLVKSVSFYFLSLQQILELHTAYIKVYFSSWVWIPSGFGVPKIQL